MATAPELTDGDRFVLWPMTTAEFAALPECQQHLELLDGQVVMTRRPSLDHQSMIGRILAVLGEWDRRRELGRAYLRVEVRLAEGWSPVPDLVFVSSANRGRIRDTHIDGPPDLAVEVLSPGNTWADRRQKYEAYARYGVTWYWIIDIDNGVLEEYEAANGVYGNRVDCLFSQPFAPRLFPGLTIDLAGLV